MGVTVGVIGQALKGLPPKMLESIAIPEFQPKTQPYKRFDEHGLFLLIHPHGVSGGGSIIAMAAGERL
jgi:hypothetical protein